MSKKEGVVPELRFPEFLDAGEWEEARLGEKDISTFVKERVPLDHLTLDNYVSTENLLPDYAGVARASKLPSTGSFTRYKQGDILVSNIRPYLKKVWAATNEGATSNDVIVIRAKSKVKDSFLTYLLRNDEFINYVMKGAKGVKMPRGDISLMKEYPVAIPANPKEQQKIADCLASVDKLIAAQTQKLCALKTHKNGLMQQLFPAEGETVPIRRFPEFRGKGEWIEKPLNKITTSIFDGTHQTPKYTNEGIPFFSVENIISGKANKFISKEDYLIATSKNKPEKGDILITRIGNIGFSTVVDWDYEFSIYVTLAVVKSDERFNSHYLHGFMQSERYQMEVQSKSLLNAVPCKINMDELRKTTMLLPCPKEQQKIADCLASIDELISNQAKKIEALKAHKKGLMQQLFPAVDEAG